MKSTHPIPPVCRLAGYFLLFLVWLMPGGTFSLSRAQKPNLFGLCRGEKTSVVKPTVSLSRAQKPKISAQVSEPWTGEVAKIFHRFDGWFKDPEFTQAIDPDTLLARTDLSLYAKYTPLWPVFAAENFAGGSGTKQDPYLISTANQLALLSRETGLNPGSVTGKYFALTTDIDLTGHIWAPIGREGAAFDGHFDGKGYLISNMQAERANFSDSVVYIGLFGKAENASITDVRIGGSVSVDLKAPCPVYIGALVGAAYHCSITHICNEKTSINNNSFPLLNQNTASGIYTGGIAGYMENTVMEDVYNTQIVYGPTAGGLVGYAQSGQILYSFNHLLSDLSMEPKIMAFPDGVDYTCTGGLVGLAGEGPLSIQHSYNRGQVGNRSAGRSGGLIGSAIVVPTLKNVYNAGSVGSSEYKSPSSGPVIGYGYTRGWTKADNILADCSGFSVNGSYSWSIPAYINCKDNLTPDHLNEPDNPYIWIGGYGGPILNREKTELRFIVNGEEAYPPLRVFARSYILENEIPEPTPEQGYHFIGWFLDSLLTEPVTPTIPVGMEDRKLYTKWMSHITFHNPGGEPIESRFYPAGESFESYGGLPVAHILNLRLDGWSSDPEHQNRVDPSHIVTRDMDLYARHMVDIRFNSNGGQTLNSIEVFGGIPYGTSSQQALPEPQKPGYVFHSWYRDMLYTDPRSEGDIVPLRHDTLYADWGDKVLAVFDAAGGGFIAEDGQPTVLSLEYFPRRAYNNAYRAPDGKQYNTGFPQAPVREDYTFVGWFRPGEISATTASATVPDSSHTFRAKWQKSHVDVRFEANGGIVSVPSYTYRTGQTYGSVYSLPTPSKEGWTFIGWFSDPVFEYLVTSASIATETDSVLYAKYGKQIIVEFGPKELVSFNSRDYTSGVPYNGAIGYVRNYGLPDLNSRYAGWFSDPACTQPVDNNTMVDENTTMLYTAERSIVRVSFQTNGGGEIPAREYYSGLPYYEYEAGNNGLPSPPSSPENAYFLGWYTSPDFLVEVDERSSLASPEITVLYARWSEQIEVSFITFEETPVTRTYNTGFNYSDYAHDNDGLPSGQNPPGRYFLGWFDAPAGGNQITNSSTVTHELSTFYARYSNPVEVSFQTNGGSPIESQTYQSGFAYYDNAYGNTGLPEAPSKENAIFLGWFASPDFSTEITRNSTVDESVTTLYAQWGEKTSVTFIDYTLNITQTKDFYHNLSYNADPNSGFPQLDNPETPAFLGWFARLWKVEDHVAAEDTVPFRPHILHARWGVPVHFETSGGSTVEDRIYTPGFAYAELPNEGLPDDPQRMGFAFEGWFADPQLNTAVYGKSLVRNTEHTLYAKWRELPPQTVEVKFETNGGHPLAPIAYQSGFAYGEEPNTGLPTATGKEGFDFIGWYAESGLVTPVTDQTPVQDNDHTLYAKWQERVSVEQDLIDAKIRIWPNPVTDICHIDAPFPIEEMILFRPDGVRLLALDGPDDKIDMSGFPEGMYFLLIRTSQATVVKKIIKR